MKKTITYIFVSAILVLNCYANAQMFWNQSAKFTGVSLTYSYVAVPNSTNLNITGSFSAEAWINPSFYSTLTRGILTKGGSL